jgi:arabinogalactan endo-1,4-beta-galactosidase
MEILRSIKDELNRAGSWLSDDQSFQTIKSLYRNEKIVHIRTDITEYSTFSKIAAWMSENNIHCDSIDLSNIPDWLDPSKLRSMIRSIEEVADNGTFIVHSSFQFDENKDGKIHQRVFQYSGSIEESAMKKSSN